MVRGRDSPFSAVRRSGRPACATPRYTSSLQPTARQIHTYIHKYITKVIVPRRYITYIASCQLKSCQLPRNSAETTCTRSPEPSISCRQLTRATKSCCRQRLTICAINYSGRASQLGGIINLVDRQLPSLSRSERPPFCRAKMITRFDDRYAVAKFSKSGV